MHKEFQPGLTIKLYRIVSYSKGCVLAFVCVKLTHILFDMLFNAYWISGAGTNEDTIVMLLTARSNDQRQQIKAAYKKAYGKVS